VSVQYVEAKASKPHVQQGERVQLLPHPPPPPGAMMTRASLRMAPLLATLVLAAALSTASAFLHRTGIVGHPLSTCWQVETRRLGQATREGLCAQVGEGRNTPLARRLAVRRTSFRA